MRWLGTILLAAPLAWLAAGWVARQRASRRARRLAELEGRIESLDVLGFLGRHDEVAPLLEAVVRDAAGMAGAGGAAARARCRILRADLAAALGRPSEARAHLESALAEAGPAPPHAAGELHARIEASLGLLATAEDRDEDLLRHGAGALAREGAVNGGATLVRLAEMAQWLGHVQRRRGRWKRARGLLESAVRIAGRLPGPAHPAAGAEGAIEWLFWSRARAAGSAAAVELGTVLCSLGRRREGIEWLDRAVAVVEPGPTELAKVAVARALLARAAQEPPDSLDHVEARHRLLARASAAGLASGWPAGRCAASEADLGLAMLHLSLGGEEEAVRHLRRAHGHVRDLDHPARRGSPNSRCSPSRAFSRNAATPRPRRSTTATFSSAAGSIATRRRGGSRPSPPATGTAC